MTTTLQAHGGGAQPASIDTSGKVAGGAAQRVYGFDSVEAAQAAGYVCEGGPAMSVALITDAQIASGAWKAEGDPAALVVYTAPDGMPIEGGYAVPVYPVNGWGSAPAPAAPLFDSAEVGTVNASTVAVTFDQGVSAAGNDYSSGVTIKVNGATRPFESGIRQSNHAIVYYALSLAVVYGDVVTWEYAEASGSIVSEDDSTPLADVTAQSVTNNVADTIGNALRADAVAYWKMDEISGTRIDATGRSNNLAPQNAPSGVTGKIGNALQLIRANSQYLSCTSGADLNLGNRTMYYALWVKLTSKDSNSSIISKTREGSNVFRLSYSASNDIFTFSSPSDLGFTCEGWSLNPVDLNTWYFVEFYFNEINRAMDIAFNNSSFGIDGLIANVPPSDSDGDYFIGREGLTYSDILIDEIGVWRRILTQTERDYLYNSGAGRTLYP